MRLIITSEFTYVYLAICLQGILYGFYSGIFAKYLQFHASQTERGNDNAKTIIFYALCTLYPLTTASIAFDVVGFVAHAPSAMNASTIIYPLYVVQGITFGCCDFMAQSILIYRCWIVWNGNTRVVIIPSILAIAFLAIWIASIAAASGQQNGFTIASWGNTLTITGLIISMTVNALVTCLIVFKIFKVFRQVKPTPDKVSLNVTGGTKLRSIIFVILESGMALFSIQFARLVITTVLTHTAAYPAFEFITAIHQMLNGITPTIILVRVSMGLSFHDETSIVEAAESVLRFAPSDDSNPNLEMETKSISQDGSLEEKMIGSSDDNRIVDE